MMPWDGRWGLLGVVAIVVAATALPGAGPASAQVAGAPVVAIPDPITDAPEFMGRAATPRPIRAERIPRHPFMAPNGRSNIHGDAFQSDTHRVRGPLGDEIDTSSSLFFRECASKTFDAQGRLITICVGLDLPMLAMLDPETLEPLATFALPPRLPSGGSNPFTDFSGGGYFYLDHRDRVVVPTTTRHIYVVRQTDGPAFELARDIDLTAHVASDDKIISALPDWDGNLWFASTAGVVGYVSRETDEVHSLDLGEHNGNSFTVDERGSVYVVTDAALYRLRAGRAGVREIWRRGYQNVGTAKPGQTQAGSGTTPTMMNRGRWVAITDNADPMNVLVMKRAREPGGGGRVVCREPVFEPGASATDQSLIAIGHSIVTENNYGYSVQEVESGGDAIEPGLTRVDVDRDGRGCGTVWESDERAPSVVPKLALRSGLVFTYTWPPEHDAWFLTAIDFRTGKTVYSRQAGGGLGFNNNYAPVTLVPGRTAYVGVLGGLVRLSDR